MKNVVKLALIILALFMFSCETGNKKIGDPKPIVTSKIDANSENTSKSQKMMDEITAMNSNSIAGSYDWNWSLAWFGANKTFYTVAGTRTFIYFHNSTETCLYYVYDNGQYVGQARTGPNSSDSLDFNSTSSNLKISITGPKYSTGFTQVFYNL